MAKTKKTLTKAERISAEYKKLAALYASLPENKLKLVDGLLHDAAFMRITLDDLQTAINSEGCVEEYQNGASQSGKHASSNTQAYNQLIRNYTNVIDRLDKNLPAQSGDKLKGLLSE